MGIVEQVMLSSISSSKLQQSQIDLLLSINTCMKSEGLPYIDIFTRNELCQCKNARTDLESCFSLDNRCSCLADYIQCSLIPANKHSLCQALIYLWQLDSCHPFSDLKVKAIPWSEWTCNLYSLTTIDHWRLTYSKIGIQVIKSNTHLTRSGNGTTLAKV